VKSNIIWKACAGAKLSLPYKMIGLEKNTLIYLLKPQPSAHLLLEYVNGNDSVW